MGVNDLDTDNLDSLRYVNQVASRLEGLFQSLSAYLRVHPGNCAEEAPVLFLALFFECYLRLVATARFPTGDSIGVRKANSKTSLAALHLIAKYANCAEEAFKLLSGSTQVPGHLTLVLDLAAPTPQERAWAAIGVFDRFWQHFVHSDVETPVSAGGAISLKAYLVKSGLNVD
jgi:hypothetical protein